MLQGWFGLEKENVRVNAKGEMARTSHPWVFGNKNTHPYFTTDFSESQLEMITPPQESISEACDFLKVLNDLFYENVEGEYLWPQSMPPVLPSSDEIPIAQYGEEGRDKEAYRNYLGRVYGRPMQMISGMHFNFSLSESLLRRLFAAQSGMASLEEFKEQLYLRIVRNFLRDRWFLLLNSGASSSAHESFEGCCLKESCAADNGVYSCPEALSMRSSPFGYTNREHMVMDYSSFQAYDASVQRLIEEDFVSLEKEIYLPIRLKFVEKDGKRIFSHLEVRILDLNPFSSAGVSKDMLYFTHLFLLYGMMKEEYESFGPEQQLQASENQYQASVKGMNPALELTDSSGKKQAAGSLAEALLKDMEKKVSFLFEDNLCYREAFEKSKEQALNPEKRAAYRVRQEILAKGYVEFHMEQARKARQLSLEQAFRFHGKEDMELSTQLLMKEAVLRGIRIDIMDREENFLRLLRGKREEYVVQATKTSLDTYSGVLKMENKIVTKDILEQAGISVPAGESYSDAGSAKADFPLHEGKAVVIKPKSTNFGLGITILKENCDRDVYERAVEIAFQHDRSILVEEFVEGKEHRIFVVGDQVVGILRRVPANVQGDGRRTIRELVEEKNQDPLRGKGYRTPLERISLGEAEQIFLSGQGFCFETVPEKGKVVYLRENSNISTGGDSIDCTDDVPQSYKDLAVKATRAMGVKITGLDMIIKDIRQQAAPGNYSVIEMNFNPAIHIHCYPYVGKNRRLNASILDALGFPAAKMKEQQT